MAFRLRHALRSLGRIRIDTGRRGAQYTRPGAGADGAGALRRRLQDVLSRCLRSRIDDETA